MILVKGVSEHKNRTFLLTSFNVCMNLFLEVGKGKGEWCRKGEGFRKGEGCRKGRGV